VCRGQPQIVGRAPQWVAWKSRSGVKCLEECVPGTHSLGKTSSLVVTSTHYSELQRPWAYPPLGETLASSVGADGHVCSLLLLCYSRA
jgi:hypothetical protein